MKTGRRHQRWDYGKRGGPMVSESTIEIRDGFVAAGGCGNREDLRDKRSGREASGHRNGSKGVEMCCLGRNETRLSSYPKTATWPLEEMNYSGGGVGTWTSRTELKGDQSWSWWCEPLIPRHSRHRQAGLLSLRLAWMVPGQAKETSEKEQWAGGHEG